WTDARRDSGIDPASHFFTSACKLSPASPPRAPLSAHRPQRFPGRVFLAVALLCLIAGFEILTKAILAAFTLIVLVPALTPAQTRHEGGRGIPSSTSGGTPRAGAAIRPLRRICRQAGTRRIPVGRRRPARPQGHCP